MPEESLVLVDDTIHDLVVRRLPTLVIEEGRKAARALKDIVDTKPGKVILNGKQYLMFEDWQTLGRFYGVTAKVVESKYVEYAEVRGFEARAVALRNDGVEISAAEAACLSDESKWRARPVYEYTTDAEGQRVRTKTGDELVPLFQLKSMAQTRACAKVLRTVLSWVVVLAGYEPTPAEEMTEPERKKPAPAKPRPAEAQPPMPDFPSTAVRITRVHSTPTKNPKVKKFYFTLSNGKEVTTINEHLANVAETVRDAQEPVIVETKKTQYGLDVVKITRLARPIDVEPDAEPPVPPEPDGPF